MRLLYAILIVVVSLVAITYVAGNMQPQQHLVTRSELIAAPPANVWQRLNDVQDEPKWRHSVRSVTVDPSQDGLPCYTEQMRTRLKECVQRVDGQRLRIISIADANADFSGTWTFLVQPGNPADANGSTTRLTLTEDAVIRPALWRGLALFTGMDRAVNQYLTDLRHSYAGVPEQS